MGVIFVDGSAIRSFVDDKASFEKLVDKYFERLDIDGDDVLSKTEMKPAFESMKLFDSSLGAPLPKSREEKEKCFESLFEKIDENHDGVVDRGEFLANEREILLAIADGLGDFPISMVVEEDSLLQEAVQPIVKPESSKVASTSTSTSTSTTSTPIVGLGERRSA